MFTEPVIDAIKAHAIAAYPDESCGVVTADGYIRFTNLHPEPRRFFNCDLELQPYLLRKTALALVHSHPDGPEGPSSWDIRSQIAQAIPWGLLMSSTGVASHPYWWGDMLPVPELECREFRHGPSGSDGKGDCYALVRDWYRVKRGITLPDFPRDNGWWEGKDGETLYESNFAIAGFQPVDRREPQIGDVILMRYPSGRTCNHAGIYIGNGQFLHHLTNRASRIEQKVRFDRFIVLWLRYAR